MDAARLPALTLGLAGALLAACTQSEYREDAGAGLNGSFETVRDGLPVNWYFYTADTAGGDFDIAIDTGVVVHGHLTRPAVFETTLNR
jgi:hypothetical protein